MSLRLRRSARWIPLCTILVSGCSTSDPLGPGLATVRVIERLVPDEWPTDPVEIRRVDVIGDTLTLDVAFSGGCETHDFVLVASSTFAESEPVQSAALLAHDDHNDPCDAVVSDLLQFDLTPLAEAWRDAYGPGSGRLLLVLSGWTGTVLYTF